MQSQAYHGQRANAQSSSNHAVPGTSYRQSPRYSTYPLPEPYNPHISYDGQGTRQRYPPYPPQGLQRHQHHARRPDYPAPAEASQGFTADGSHYLESDPMMARKPKEFQSNGQTVHTEEVILPSTMQGGIRTPWIETGGGDRRRSSRSTWGTQSRRQLEESNTRPMTAVTLSQERSDSSDDEIGAHHPNALNAPLQSHRPIPRNSHLGAVPGGPSCPLRKEIISTTRSTTAVPRAQEHNKIMYDKHKDFHAFVDSPPLRGTKPIIPIAQSSRISPAPRVPRKDRTQYGKIPRVPEVQLVPESREESRSGARVSMERRERRSAMPLKEMEDDLSCPICMSVMVATHAVSPCGHTLCGGCAYEWIRENRTCAICRNPLAEGNGLIPVHSMDALIERYVAHKGETWDGLEEFKEKKEIWAAQRAIIREEEAARAPTASASIAVGEGWGSGTSSDELNFYGIIQRLTQNPESLPPGFFHRTSSDDFFGSPTTQYTHTGRHIPDSAFAEMLTFIDTLHDNERLHPQMRTFSQPPWLSTMNYGDYAMNGTIPSGAHTRSAEEGISARVLSALRQRW